MRLQTILIFSFIFPIYGRIERRCDSIDIRNTPQSAFMQTGSNSNWQTFNDCTILDGDLTLSMITGENFKDEDFKTFPNLRIITGSVVVFHVHGLTSLKPILPNLRIIGGQSLVMNYALVIYQNPHIETIGLDKLTLIRNGGVRIKNNPKLCYVENINWLSILGGKVRDVVVENSGYTSEDDVSSHSRLTSFCADKIGCYVDDPSKCHTSNGTLSCWNSTYCQKYCKYFKNSDNNLGPGCDSNGEKCHPLCIGGCDYPNDSEHCYACRYVENEGTCMQTCPSGTYELLERRCITKDECSKMRPVSSSTKGSENMKWKAFKGKCHYDCPKGYQEDENDSTTCKKCESHCPKKCHGGIVESIGEALLYSKCNIIEGSLEVAIKIGEPVAPEKFTEAFGEIEEIMGFLIVRFSPALTSLYMFKSLAIIHGKDGLINNKFSLVVEENANLRNLFNIEKQPLKLLNGTVSFQNNKLLCKDKIDYLLIHMKINPLTAEVSQYSNGDRAVCNEVPINVTVVGIEPFAFILKWDKFNTTNMDQRKFYGYEIFYKKVNEIDTKMSKEEDRMECSDSWKTKFVSTTQDFYKTGIIVHAEPNTIYAFYVQTRVINHPGARSGSSEIQFVTTLFGQPGPPKIRIITSENPTEIGLKWDSSINPKGVITHYQVLWTAEPDSDIGLSSMVDPCTVIAHRTQLIKAAKEKLQKDKNDEGTCSANKGCCKCSDIVSADASLIEAVEFDNEVLKLKNNEKRHVSNESNSSGTKSVFMEMKNTVRKRRDSSNYEFLHALRIRNNMTDDGGYGSANVTGNTVVITGLKHFTLYKVAVRACQDVRAKENHCSSIRVTSSVRTDPIPANDIVDVDSIKVHEMTGLNNTKRLDVRRISWKPPKDPNSKLLAFKVSVWKGADTPLEQCVRYEDFIANGNSVIFNGLTTGNYNFAVHSLTLLGLSKPAIQENFFEVYIPGFFTFENIFYIVVGTILFIILAIIGGKKYYERNFGKEVEKFRQKMININPDYIPPEFYEIDEWEVKREDLEIKEEIGSGTFGKVYKGYGKNILSHNGIKFGNCAIKMVSDNATNVERIHFLLEASVMKEFDTSFIVKLLGIVSEGQPVLVVMELMENTNLRDFLRARRPDSEDNINRLPLPSMLNYFKWAIQIADGMAYLEWKKFVHRDLAARNCMVTADEQVKIGDFGMARDIYYHNYYRPAGKRLMPVRWMAPEALKDGTFSVKSDVWSYGVVLYEMLTLGEQPYAGLGNDQVFTYVGMKRNVLLRPTGCPDFWYDLMRVCWKYDPKERPWFYQIVLHLQTTVNRTPLKNALMALFDRQCFVTSIRIHNDQVEEEDYDFAYNEEAESSKRNRMLRELEKLQLESATDYEYEALKHLNKRNQETEGLDLINAEALKYNMLTLDDMDGKIEVPELFAPKQELDKLGRKQSGVNELSTENLIQKREPMKSKGSRRLPPETATSDMDKMKESKQVHQRLKDYV